MVLSESRKFVFIHVPKTAGTSLTEALRAVDRTAVTTLPGLPSTKHVTALQVREAYPGFDNLFSFAVLRDPYARFCSLYRYVQTLPRYAERMKTIASLEEFAQLFEEPSWVDQLHSAKPQVDFVTDQAGKLIVDAIFRFEELSQAVEQLSSRIGITRNLPHRRATQGDGLAQRNRFVERIVATRFKRDFDFLARVPCTGG